MRRRAWWCSRPEGSAPKGLPLEPLLLEPVTPVPTPHPPLQTSVLEVPVTCHQTRLARLACPACLPTDNGSLEPAPYFFVFLSQNNVTLGSLTQRMCCVTHFHTSF